MVAGVSNGQHQENGVLSQTQVSYTFKQNCGIQPLYGPPCSNGARGSYRQPGIPPSKMENQSSRMALILFPVSQPPGASWTLLRRAPMCLERLTRSSTHSAHRVCISIMGSLSTRPPVGRFFSIRSHPTATLQRRLLQTQIFANF